MAHKKEQTKSTYISMIIEIVVLILIIFLVRTFFFGLYQVPTGSMETTMLVGERFFAEKLSYWFTKPKHNEIIAFNDPFQFNYSNNRAVRLWQEYVWGPSNWTKRIIAEPNQTVKGVLEDGKPVVYVDGKKLDEPYINHYPLVYVFNKDPNLVRRQLRNYALSLVSYNELDRMDVDAFVQDNMRAACDAHPKSYDPNKPFDQQPFYRINPDRVLKVDGKPLLVWPGTPLPPRQEVKKGKNYWDGTDEFYVELGPDQYWVMGDNREGSNDSRFWGPLDRRLIHGKILLRIWSIDSSEGWWIVDLIKHPIDFWKRMRWSRFFQVVK